MFLFLKYNYFNRQSWEHLLQLIEHRDKKLQAAGEIHRFHRDVAESLSRIHEKDAALGNDLARDLNSALALYRRHEGFENDLVALEVQLQLLIDDAQQLQVKYPKNAQQIIQRQEQVVEFAFFFFVGFIKVCSLLGCGSMERTIP